MTERKFFYYNARHLSIEQGKPWYVCSAIGCVVAKLATEEQAQAAVAALNSDKAAGTLPCNLSNWSKRHLLG